MSGNIKKHYKHGFVTVDADMYRDVNLSCKERGMIGTLLSLPDDWNFSAIGLSSILPESKNTINTILQSLEIKGYLKRTRIYENGRVSDWFYDFYDYPAFNENDEEKPLNTTTSQKLGSSNSKLHPKNQDLEFLDIENWDDNLYKQESNIHKSIINNNNINSNQNKTYNNTAIIEKHGNSVVENNTKSKGLDKKRFITSQGVVLLKRRIDEAMNSSELSDKAINYLIDSFNCFGESQIKIINQFSDYEYVKLLNITIQLLDANISLYDSVSNPKAFLSKNIKDCINAHKSYN